MPELTADHSVYKGKRVYLMNFENQANDTSVWYYFSPDKKFRYGTDTFIHNYFWYSFQAALIEAILSDPGFEKVFIQAPGDQYK